MKRALMAIAIGTILLPTVSLSHEGRRRDDDRWRDRYEHAWRAPEVPATTVTAMNAGSTGTILGATATAFTMIRMGW
jgi:hypothetical protein